MSLKDFSFVHKGKKINLKVKECKDWLSKGVGLMFKKTSPCLLFVFNTSKKRAIHSLFCKPFVGVWLDEDKIVDVKMVRPWKTAVYPKKKFNRLLEIPSDSTTFKLFLDAGESFK